MKEKPPRPGGPLQYRPGQGPDGVWRNPYKEPETPKNVPDPEALEHFNNLVVKYYNALKMNKKEDAERPIVGEEQAMRVLGFSEMPRTKEEVNSAFRNLLRYAHPDKNQHLNIQKFSEAAEVITKKLQEARDILLKRVDK